MCDKSWRWCARVQVQVQQLQLIMSLFLLLIFRANAANLVRTLPGYEGELPFKLETGYVGVGNNKEVQLFYYFVESQRDPAKDPLLLWLTGGPGCSGLSAILFEVGPFQFDYTAYNGGLPSLIPNPYAYTQVASVIFLDAPAGTGFSYSTTEDSITDISAAHSNYQFLQKWLSDHPNFLKNSLYIAGDSYSGIIIPILVQEIREGLEARHEPKINLHGYIIGNPVTNITAAENMRVPFAHRLSLLSDELYESARLNCNGDYVHPDLNNTPCMKDLEAVHKCVGAVFGPHILQPNCPFFVGDNISDAILIDTLRGKKPYCLEFKYVLSSKWANDPRVREALHIRNGTKEEWLRCNQTIPYVYIVHSAVEYHRSFLNTSYRALIYRMRTQQRKPEDDTADPTRPAAVAVAAGLRKKGTGTRSWLFLDTSGQAQVVEAGKHAIMRRTGLPARDLRILDPKLSYPSTVLGREKAIVINLEHIKAIITAQEVLLQNSKDPFVMAFVDELQRKILRHHQAMRAQEGGGNADEPDWANLYDLEDSRSGVASPENSAGSFPKSEKDEEGQEEGKQGLDRDGMKVLPFEFVALEACLEATCTSLDNDARTLEQEAHPALDKLTSKISTLNLERVRQIKSRLVAITGRVQKVRDELEHLLDDDDDMAEMYLTEKMIQQNLENSSVSSVNDREEADSDDMNERDPADISMEINGEGDPQIMGNTSKAFSRVSHRTHTSTTRSAISKQLDVEELEMLLEAYFVQIDGTLNKLSTLREYVDDTEDYINIMLDDKQNNLLQMGVMLTTATLVVSAFVVVAGIFGMNIHIDLFNDEKNKSHDFIWTVGGGTAGSIVLYIIAIAWCRRKQLLE